MRNSIKKLFVLVSIFSISACTYYSPSTPPSDSSPVTFVAIGDMPYSDAEITMVNAPNGELFKAIQKLSPAVLVHFGDLDASKVACTDQSLQDSYDLMANIFPHKILYTPGDNDWTDCDRPTHTIRFNELERLNTLRELFFSAKNDKLTRDLTGLVRQPNVIENSRWQSAGLVFGTLHIPGTNNGRVGISVGNVEEILDEADRRDLYNKHWIDQLFLQADNAKGLVISFQADIYQPSSKRFPVKCNVQERSKCDGYMTTREYIEYKASLVDTPVLMIHGDTSAYCMMQPAKNDAPNLWRLNGLGDYLYSDAAQVTFNPNNKTMPFDVVSLMGQERLPVKCEYNN